MRRYLFLVIMLLSLFQSVSWGAEKKPPFTQKDFATMILKQFSWNAGLPNEPADRDYLMIFGGKRSYRYEAENAYNAETDLVTLRNIPVYGDFTGTGWIYGTSSATESILSILVPLAGEYELKAVIKGNGFIWTIDNQEFRVDSKSGGFRETDIAKVKLKAGVVTIKLGIPPDGAIDSLSLTAPNNPIIQPLMGWRFKEALTAVRMAEIVVALTNRYAQLPDSISTLKSVAVAEITNLPPSAALTDADYLGSFFSTKWVRADYRGATLKIPLTVAESGYYRLIANVLGDNLSGNVNDVPFKLSGKPYLSKIDLGVYRLESGSNNISISLPVTGGIDTIELIKKSSKSEDIMRLAGVPGSPGRLIKAKEAAELLKKIQVSVPIQN